MVQAVLEGVGYTLREARDVIEQAGTPINRLIVIGGGSLSLSHYWLQLLADILERTIYRCEDSASGLAFGAARLARLAATQEVPDEVCWMPETDRVFKPCPVPGSYANRFERFKRLYRAVEPEFGADW